jgi:hypothetical protein
VLRFWEHQNPREVAEDVIAKVKGGASAPPG